MSGTLEQSIERYKELQKTTPPPYEKVFADEIDLTKLMLMLERMDSKQDLSLDVVIDHHKEGICAADNAERMVDSVNDRMEKCYAIITTMEKSIGKNEEILGKFNNMIEVFNSTIKGLRFMGIVFLLLTVFLGLYGTKLGGMF